MAKMNKTELIAFMKQAARNHTTVNELALVDLANLDYRQRLEFSDALATQVTLPDSDARYEDAAREAFAEQARSIWTAKEDMQKRRRRDWARACDGLTLEQATKMVTDLLQSMNIRGARVGTGYMIDMSVQRGRCEARLYVKFDRADFEGVRNPDDDSQRAGRYELKVEISTTGTTYTLAEMAVMHKIHGELLDAAAEVQAVMENERIIWTYGVPEVVEEKTPLAVTDSLYPTR